MPSWLSQFVGADYAPLASWALAAIVVLIALFVVIFVAKRALGGVGGPRAKRGPRLAIMDVTAIDPRRKLVLVRRDEVEHLILIGGQNDLVVEASILRVPASLRSNRAEPAPRHEPELGEAAERAGVPSRTVVPAAHRGASPLTRPVPRPAPRPAAPVIASEPATMVVPPAEPAPAVEREAEPATAMQETTPPEPEVAPLQMAEEPPAPVVAPPPQPVRARPATFTPVPAPRANAQPARVEPPAPAVEAAPRAVPSFLRRNPEVAPPRPAPEPERPVEAVVAEQTTPPQLPPAPTLPGFQTIEVEPPARAPAVEPPAVEPTVEKMPPPVVAAPAVPRREPSFSALALRVPGAISPVIAAAERQRETLRGRGPERIEPAVPPAPPSPSPVFEAVEPKAVEPKAMELKAPETAPEPAEELERRPLSVRSFASVIQNRKPSFEPAPERREPVSVPASTPLPVLAAAPLPVAVTKAENPKPAGEAGSLEDFLSAELDSDFGTNFWEAEVRTPAAPTPAPPLVIPAAAPEERAAAPVQPRKMTLEEEMERLLGDFDFDTSGERRKR